MRVTWLVPDVYGFITDELHELSARDISIRVLSGQSITPSIRRQLQVLSFIIVHPKVGCLRPLASALCSIACEKYMGGEECFPVAGT